MKDTILHLARLGWSIKDIHKATNWSITTICEVLNEQINIDRHDDCYNGVF
jgi:hypothetical protein